MNRKTGFAAAAAAGILVFLGSFLWEAKQEIPDPGEARSLVRAGDGWYGVSGRDGELMLFRADGDGTIRRCIDAPEDAAFLSAAVFTYQEEDEETQEEETKYDLLLLFQEEENGKAFYSLDRYSRELECVSTAQELSMDGELLGALTVKDTAVYIPAASADRKQAAIYQVDLSKEEPAAEQMTLREASEGRYFIGASGDGENFYAFYNDGSTWLYNGETAGESAEPLTGEEELPEELGGVLAIIGKDGVWLAAKAFLWLLAYEAAVLLIYSFFIGKSYLARRLALQEAVLIAVLAVLVAGPQRLIAEQAEERAEALLLAGLSQLKDEMPAAGTLLETEGSMADSEQYRQVYEQLLSARKGAVTAQTFDAVYLVSCADGACTVLMGDDTACGTPVSETLGSGAEALVRTSKDSSREQYSRESKAFVLPAGDGISQSVFWIGVLKEDSGLLFSDNWQERMLPAAIGIWAGVSAVLGILLFVEAGNMRRISEEMHEVSTGKASRVRRSGAGNSEAERMWDALEDYARNRQRFRYVQGDALRACMRFLPDGIESLAKSGGIGGLAPGDSVSESGVVGCLSQKTAGDDAGACSQMLAVLLNSREESGGVLLPENGDLSAFWALFSGNPDQAVSFGLHSLSELGSGGTLPEARPVLLLHYTKYAYGVAGSESRLFARLSVREREALLKFSEKLAALQVSMAMTESVKIRISPSVKLRCIGYVSMEPQGKQKLYEVLDAYPAKKRQALEGGREKFKEALNLYYRSDFYFARNLFTELLKSCPQDGTARWYLFRCERMLGGGAPEDFSYELFAEE